MGIEYVAIIFHGVALNGGRQKYSEFE